VIQREGLAAALAASALWTITAAGPARPQAAAGPDKAPHAAREVPAEVAARLDIGVTTATRRPIARDIDLVGTVAFDESRVAMVGSRITGRVTALGARPGETLRAGDIVAELESVELARAGAEYLGLKARARAADANAARERELARRQVSSAREREVAIADAESLRAQVLASEQLLMALGLRRDELPEAGSDRPLSRFSVRVPIDGVVVDRYVVLGEFVDAGKTIAKIADLSNVWVNLNVFERDLAWVRVGLEAQLTIDAYPDLRPRAYVRYIKPEVDSATRTARVQLDVANPGSQLRPGQFVTARLKSAGTDTEDLTVPRDAVQMVDGVEMVFVKLPDGAFSMRPVKLGTRGTADVEVIDGLAPGDQVAVKNAFLLKSEFLR